MATPPMQSLPTCIEYNASHDSRPTGQKIAPTETGLGSESCGPWSPRTAGIACSLSQRCADPYAMALHRPRCYGQVSKHQPYVCSWTYKSHPPLFGAFDENKVLIIALERSWHLSVNNMSASQLRAWTEQQIAERHNFTTLPPPQAQQYFTGRFTQRDALQDTSTENSGWEHFAEIETTRREWIPILTDTPGGRNRTGVSNLSARVLGQHGAFRALDNCAHPLGQHHESGAPDVSAEVFKENDEQETSNVRTELSTQHAEPEMPNGPAELLINGVVYHRSSYGRRAEESR